MDPKVIPAFATAKLSGIVESIIESPRPEIADRAHISIDGSPAHFREIEIDSTLQDANGKRVPLVVGGCVKVTIKADSDATTPK